MQAKLILWGLVCSSCQSFVPPLLVVHPSSARTMSTPTSWTSLDPESLVAAPCLIEQTLCQVTGDKPQLAKDLNYAKAVLDAWKEQEADSGEVWTAETTPIAYTDSQGTCLYGHLVRRAGGKSSVPGILLFHTAAGPHDLFLLWKAAALVNTIDCVALVADLLGDDSGWGWSVDRSQYNAARDELLRVANDERPLLRDRIQAAIDSLVKVDRVDSERLAALGWCFGGHPILELGRMNLKGMRAMATFHGIFETDLAVPEPQDLVDKDKQSEILLCHGTKDPFVTEESLERALETFQNQRHVLSLLQLPVKHGFTNPAQAFNENPAFGFDKEAADKAWRQTVSLLSRRLA